MSALISNAIYMFKDNEAAVSKYLHLVLKTKWPAGIQEVAGTILGSSTIFLRDLVMK